MTNKYMDLACLAITPTKISDDVLMLLADMADDAGHISISLNDISCITGRAKETVSRAIKALIEVELLLVSRNSGHCSTYVLMLWRYEQ